ncbi:hypothetical protein EZS27_002945 [termite gut metagenome]|uniref:Transposase DDE domain-containing protein n=1 Tax=termite gut metagenome TaxID=433724 RepID=A0A5J4SUF7_9ZZZZ
MIYDTTYKIRNWKEYNKSLCQRGSFTLWLEDSVLQEWEYVSRKPKEVGTPILSGQHNPLLPVTENQLSLKVASEYGFYSKSVFSNGKESFRRT